MKKEVLRSYISDVLHPLKTKQRIFEYYKDSLFLHEIFGEQIYYWLSKRLRSDTTLIDLGANMGDTASYFTLFPQVKLLIGYECDQRTYERALDFLKKNPYSGKIKLYRKEVGREITLNEILEGHKRIAIKCDIEGAEHKIFTDEADLSNVYAIQMEYHYNLQRLPAVLRSKGFKVETKQWKRNAEMKRIGDLRAWR